MERRDFLEKFGMGAAVMGTLAAAPQAAMPAGVSDTANRNSFRAADFGAVGNGSADDTAAIQRAVDAAHNLGGGTVYLEGNAGRDFKCAGQISFDNKRGVRIVGSAGPNVPASGQRDAQLNYTGTASPFISIRSGHSITFETLKISYSNTSFNGSLVETGHSPVAKADPTYLLFDRCRFAGNGKANRAEYLLNLALCICSTVRNCEFQGSNVGIVGVSASGRYSNAIQIRDSVFRDQGKVAIKSACESWLISGCTFEPLAGGRAGAYTQGSNTTAWGLVFIGCWMGDVNASGGCWIDLTEGVVVGLTIMGNRIAPAGTGSRDTAIKIGNGKQGVTIAGNRIEGPVCIDFLAGYTFGASITGNDLQGATPIANLGNVMNHFVAGHYTTPASMSGTADFEVGTFSGNGVRGNVNLAPQNYMPTKPENGDMWTTKTSLFVRINGVTKQVTLA